MKTLTFKEWLRTSDSLLEDVDELERQQLMCEGPFSWVGRAGTYIGDKWRGFWDWLKEVKSHSVTMFKFCVWAVKHSPEIAEVILHIPSILRAISKSRVARELATNKSVLSAIQSLGEKKELDQNNIKTEINRLQQLVSHQTDEVAAAEEFWRSSVGSFVKTLWKLSHLGPIFSRLPQVTVVNAWKTLMSFYDKEQKGIRVAGGVKTALAAAIELFQYIAAAALFTGLLGKVLLAMKIVGLGLALMGGSWIVWGILALWHKGESKDVADDEKSFMAKVVAGLITAIDPGANLGLVDKAAGIKPAQEPVAEEQPVTAS